MFGDAVLLLISFRDSVPSLRVRRMSRGFERRRSRRLRFGRGGKGYMEGQLTDRVGEMLIA
jgi:hypothetical protein